MYSDQDLQAAVFAGVLSPDAAAAFRAHVAANRSTTVVDEEHFRLISGFNDIFVSIAAILLLVAVGWIGARTAPIASPAIVAACAWGLAEYFTRVRRMALPSILLLIAFVCGMFGTAAIALLPAGALYEIGDREQALRVALAAAIAAGAAWAHWRRFMVPITIAAGTAAVVGVALALLLSVVPAASEWLRWLMFVAGLAVFAFAMRWDMADPGRQTRRSDVAFWLHLLAAPLIVHPVFSLLGLLSGGGNAGEAVVVVLLYVGLGLVALAIDRRALMVSALAYVLYAISSLMETFGAVNLGFALTALVIGSALLLLSAFWHRARRAVVEKLPVDLQRRLPELDRPVVSPPPAS